MNCQINIAIFMFDCSILAKDKEKKPKPIFSYLIPQIKRYFFKLKFDYTIFEMRELDSRRERALNNEF